jgi:hydroxymethylbilane synthase
LIAQVTQIIPSSIMLPAVGQGALGIETRANDRTSREILDQIDNADAHQSVLAERTLLAALRGGCLAPIGAWGRIENDGRLHLSAVVLSADGKARLSTDLYGNAADAIALGRQAAEHLLDDGAAKLITQARQAD